MAFVPGIVEQTNEVMVLLGANHFALRSSFQAREILSRRKAKLESSLEKISAAIEDGKGVAERITKKVEDDHDQKENDDEKPVHIHETFEQSQGTLNVPQQKPLFEPISSEKHEQIMARLEELERLESMDSNDTNNPMARMHSKETNTAKSSAFSGTIQERNSSSGGNAEVDTTKRKERVSLFKQQRMNQRPH
mmetsp:Transcript_9250/g.10548  ORF Transcript_9250/g.10548 Transcript_9250/m.10548 type:complete len:193 (+) Transcript_9250:355-933(+)